MFYLIQDNLFREAHFQKLLEGLRKMGLPHEVVKVFPYTEKVVRTSDVPDHAFDMDDLPEFSPPPGKVFVFGTLKLASIARKKGWKPGSLLDEGYDYISYFPHYRENLLNSDSIVMRLGDEIPWKGEPLFLRPTQDSKAFVGKVFDQGEWEELYENYSYNYPEVFHPEVTIQVSSPKVIHREIRTWIVKGRVATASTYRVGSQVIYSAEMVDPEAVEFAERMAAVHSLSDAFVMDVCHTPEGWKIVECGDISCAGFYAADMQKILVALEAAFH